MYKNIKIDDLYISTLNVRKDIVLDDDEDNNIDSLSNDIKNNGLINPISVRENDGKYEIYAGMRRFKAIQKLKWDNIPCIINNYDDKKIELISLSENLQRNKMKYSDKCEIIYKFYNLFNKDINLISDQISLKPYTIKNYITIKEKLNIELIKKFDGKSDDRLSIDLGLQFCKYILDMNKQLELFNLIKILGDYKHKIIVLQEFQKNPNINIKQLIKQLIQDKKEAKQKEENEKQKSKDDKEEKKETNSYIFDINIKKKIPLSAKEIIEINNIYNDSKDWNKVKSYINNLK